MSNYAALSAEHSGQPSLAQRSISPLVTIFADTHGKVIECVQPMTLEALGRLVREVKPRKAKADLPLLKLATFGPVRTDKGALRHDDNVLTVSGIVTDYDAGAVSLKDAADRLRQWGVSALLYTSPSYKPDAPRWRVVCPLEEPLEGSTAELRAQHAHWVERLNGMLGGLLAGESWTLSQHYYFGATVAGQPVQTILLDGQCIDQLDELPEPIGKAGKTDRVNATGNPLPTRPRPAALEHIRDIANAEHIYHSALSLTGRYVQRGLPADESAAIVQAILLQHEDAWAAERSRWEEIFGKIPKMAKDAEEKIRNGTWSRADTGDWPEPANFLENPAAPELDPADVPGCIGEFAAAFSEASGIDPGAILLPSIACLASALHDSIYIVGDPRTGWHQSARLWSLVVAPPGCGKTPAQNAALSPLWAIGRERLEAWKLRASKLGPDDPKPPRPRVVVTDATIEALSSVLLDNPRGVLVAADEFESWLGSLDAYRRGGGPSKDRGDWLRLFDGGPHTVERVVRGAVFIENFGVSVVTATTPAALAKMSKHLPEDGLLQRFLPVLVRRIGEPNPTPTRDATAAAERYARVLNIVADMLPGRGVGVKLDPDAMEAFQGFRRRNGVRVDAISRTMPALAGHLAKHPTLLLRLVLTLHAAAIAEEVDDYLCAPYDRPVNAATLAQAARLLERIEAHAVALYTGVAGDTGPYGLARAVGRYLLATLPDELTRRDLLQRVGDFRAADERDQAEALRLLADLGWVSLGRGKYNTAMPTVIHVNPRIRSTFAAEAQAEQRRREARRELLHDRLGDARG